MAKRKYRVEVRKGKIRYYYVVMADNYEIISTSEHYFSRSNAIRAAIKLAKELNMDYVLSRKLLL